MKTNYLHKALAVAAVVCLPLTVSSQTIKVDASKVENRISPYLYGAGMEDVNHEIYGGLYDQRIFGESFEEPVPSGQVEDFMSIDGEWGIADGVIRVNGYDGAKLVYEEVDLVDGTIEVDVKFDVASIQDHNGGLILRLTDPSKGADSFNGYEIALSSDGKKVLLARHQYNFTPITDNRSLSVNPTEWNTLKVEMDGTNFKIYINDVKCIDHNDNGITTAGKVSLRNWRENVSYRNLKITPKGGTTTAVPFVAKKIPEVSRMWDAITDKNATVVFKHIANDAYNTKHSQEIDYQSGSGKVGIANRSLNKWGIAVKKDQKFQGSLFLKGTITGKVKVALQSVDGTTEYAVKEIDAITADWAKYNFELTSNAKDVNARLAIYTDKPGKFRVDMVTLMGTGDDQFKGLPFRNDIGQAMVDQGLTFLRYGGTMVNTNQYKFKNMIGPREDRPGYTGHWYKYSTNGFGIEEFLQYCEAAGFVASFAVNVEETPQDMADMIEYLNGPVTSVWGKKRAENGHPEPYNFKYLEIGNEEVIWNGDFKADYQRYINQFNGIYDAVKAKDPNVVFINAAWWRRDQLDNMKMVFDALNGKAEYWDYHPWTEDPNAGKSIETELREMQSLFKQWDPNTNMKCALFEENGNIHNMRRALSHTTTQNAARRLGEFMLTTCAANALEPYKQNDNGWNQGQVFFTPSQVWGMPPFYAQQMASSNHKPYRISSTAPATLDVVAATDKDREEVVLYVVNTNGYSVTSTIDISETGKVIEGKTLTLSGQLDDANTPENPTKIVPVEKALDVTDNVKHSFPAYSYTVMVFKYEKKPLELGAIALSDLDEFQVSSLKKQVNIRSLGQPATYQLYSTSGVCLSQGKVSAGGEVRESCDAGAYLVVMSSDKGKATYKVLVQ